MTRLLALPCFVYWDTLKYTCDAGSESEQGNNRQKGPAGDSVRALDHDPHIQEQDRSFVQCDGYLVGKLKGPVQLLVLRNGAHRHAIMDNLQ